MAFISTHKAAQVLGFLSIAVASFVRADEFNTDGIAIDVPERFEGTATAQPDTYSRTYVFTGRATSLLLPSTVLQITVYNAPADIQAARSVGVSERYLSQMLEGIERRRTEYQQTPSKEIRLAGFPGSVASWQGKANGIGTNGKMFCIVTNSEILFFHVMGGGSVPNPDMAAAIKAVENARSSGVNGSK